MQFREDLHTLTRQSAHSEPMSEYLRVTVTDAGSQTNPQVPYRYSVPSAPVGDETAASIWVRASRPGVQFYARVVLPKVVRSRRFEHAVDGHTGRRQIRTQRRTLAAARASPNSKAAQRRTTTAADKVACDINLADATIDINSSSTSTPVRDRPKSGLMTSSSALFLRTKQLRG